MAKNQDKDGGSNVTKITALDSVSSRKKLTKKLSTKKDSKLVKSKTKSVGLDQGDEVTRNPIKGFFGYFVNSWHELQQVRWPTRRATWSLTFAVLAFSAFFVVFILLLDAVFKFLFETILK